MEKASADFKYSENEKETISNDEKKSLLEETRSYKDKIKGTALGFLVVIVSATSGVSVQLLERRIPDLELKHTEKWWSLHSVFSCPFIQR